MATQIGIDPSTGEPIYAPLTPAQLAAIGYDAQGHAIPNFQYNQQVWQQANPGVTNTSLNTVISEQPLTTEALHYIQTQAITQPITPDIVQRASVLYPVLAGMPYAKTSTMYQLGFNTPEEYTGQAMRTGKGKFYAERNKPKEEVKKPVNEKFAKALAKQSEDWQAYEKKLASQAQGTITLSQSEYDKIQAMHPRDQFEYYKEHNFIPKDSEFVPVDETGQWHYQQQGTYQQERTSRQQQAIFSFNNVQLNTGEFIKKTDIASLIPEQAKYLQNNGTKAFNDKYSKVVEDKTIPTLNNYIDNYFQQKDWIGGYIPGKDITLAPASQQSKLLDEYNQHLLEATKTYKDKYGQDKFNNEIISTAPARITELFPSILVPAQGLSPLLTFGVGALQSLVVTSIPIVKGHFGAGGYSNVTPGEWIAGLLGLVSLHEVAQNYGDILANSKLTNYFNKLEASQPLKMATINSIPVYGESGNQEIGRYIYSSDGKNEIYIPRLSKGAKFGGETAPVGLPKEWILKAGKLTLPESGQVGFNVGDLNPPILVQPEINLTSSTSTRSGVEASTRTMTPEQVANLLGLSGLVVKAFTPTTIIAPIKPLKEINPVEPYLPPDIRKIVTVHPEIAPMIHEATNIGIKTAQQAKNKNATVTQINMQTNQAVQNALETKIQSKLLTKQQTKTITQTVVKEALKTQLLIRPPIIVPMIKVNIPFTLPKIEIKKLQKKLLRAGGKIAWKQGFMWWIINYPYKSQKDISHSRIKPESAYIVKGVGSAYRTIQLLTGEAPNYLTVAVGAFTATISGEHPTLKFTRARTKPTYGELTVKGVRS